MIFSRSLILASSSPRRRQLLSAAGYRFTVCAPDVEESYPKEMSAERVAVYLAEKKARAAQSQSPQDAVIVAADTVVLCRQRLLGKPANRQEAVAMLQRLSATKHLVITGVCLLDGAQKQLFDDRAEVSFRTLARAEIDYYVDQQAPFDKAGGYGIQDWIGLVGVTRIYGAYSTVMGLPMHEVHLRLQHIGGTLL